MKASQLCLPFAYVMVSTGLLAACGSPAALGPTAAPPSATAAPSQAVIVAPTTAATPTPAPPTPTLTPAPTSTKTPTPGPTPTLAPQAKVILAWHEAFNAKDINAFMALVADDAELDRGPYGVVKGKDKIRATLLLELKDNARAVVSDLVVQGDQVTYSYVVYVGGRQVDQGSGVAIVKNGKIKSDLPAPAAPPFPIGAFAMEDVDGKWMMTFTADGNFTLTRNGGLWVEGRYILDQNQITIHDAGGPKLSTCKGKGDGTYTWSFDGKVLTFEVVNDLCDGRRGTQLAKWTKQP